ncbi:hypothetical protein [Nitrosomonas sp.]|uniref:hypothetical protein n=1 Tax=Nitrosomonas sp. TaxID=42353 RepID=UPI00260475B0|nr:hypothetical protein [Nitrosomonas sp.]
MPLIKAQDISLSFAKQQVLDQLCGSIRQQPVTMSIDSRIGAQIAHHGTNGSCLLSD